MKEKGLGRWGERKAVELLRRKGYRIVEQNFRCPVGEVDIVARLGSRMVFVEVKTRRSESFGMPCESVTWEKQRRLRRIAEYYMMTRRLSEMELCVDVVEVILRDGRWYARHLEDALSE